MLGVHTKRQPLLWTTLWTSPMSKNRCGHLSPQCTRLLNARFETATPFSAPQLAGYHGTNVREKGKKENWSMVLFEVFEKPHALTLQTSPNRQLSVASHRNHSTVGRETLDAVLNKFVPLQKANFLPQATKHGKKVEKLIPLVQQFLKEGVLREDYVLDSIPKLMSVIRECNVTLRWMILHTAALSPSKDWKPGKWRLLQICTATAVGTGLMPVTQVGFLVHLKLLAFWTKKQNTHAHKREELQTAFWLPIVKRTKI